MAIVQDPAPAETGAGLTGREVRRVVALILAAEAEKRAIAPLSGIIPGLSVADGRLIRDATVRAREAAGDGIAALCTNAGVHPLIVSDRMLHDAHLPVDAGEQEVTAHAIVGARVPIDAMRAALDGSPAGPLRGELVLGMAVMRRPFGDVSAAEADVVGVNGGLVGVALGTTTPFGTEEFTVTHADGAVAASGRLPSANEVWTAALAGCAEALRTCPPLAERLMAAGSYFSHPLGEPVFALSVGDALTLPPGATLAFDVSSVRVATVTSIHRPDPQSGGTQ